VQYFTTQFYARHDTIVEEGDYGLEMCDACIHTCACAHACLRMLAQQHAELRIDSDSRRLRLCALLPCGFRDSVRHVDLRPRCGRAPHCTQLRRRFGTKTALRRDRRVGRVDGRRGCGAGRLLCDRWLWLGCFVSRYVVMKGTIQVSRLGSASEHMQQEEGEART
jgi:hypothetical protein